MVREKYNSAMRIVEKAKNHVRWCIEVAATRADMDMALANLAKADLDIDRIISAATIEEVYEILLPNTTELNRAGEADRQ